MKSRGYFAGARGRLPAIGYRHIVGIKKWGAYEKAAFVVELLRDPQHRDFTLVGRLTGESVAKVRTYFRDFLVLDQAAQADIETEGARDEFGKFTRAMNEPKLRECIEAVESQEIAEAADSAYGDDEAMRNVLSRAGHAPSWKSTFVTSTARMPGCSKRYSSTPALKFLRHRTAAASTGRASARSSRRVARSVFVTSVTILGRRPSFRSPWFLVNQIQERQEVGQGLRRV
jgi:hypothetical protein